MAKALISSKGKHFWWFCPGCETEHVVPLAEDAAIWTMTGNLACPTLQPSCLQHEIKTIAGQVISPRCHCYIRAGTIEFLSDCGHALAGRKVAMLDFPVNPVRS